MKIFFEYIKLIVKNLYFILSAIVNVIGIFVNFISDVRIPAPWLIGVAMFGFVASNYILFKNNAPFTTIDIREIDKNPIVCDIKANYNLIKFNLFYDLTISNNSNRNEIIKDIKIEEKSRKVKPIYKLIKYHIGEEKVPSFADPLANIGLFSLVDYPLLINSGETKLYVISLHLNALGVPHKELENNINTLDDVELVVTIKKDKKEGFLEEEHKICIKKDKLISIVEEEKELFYK